MLFNNANQPIPHRQLDSAEGMRRSIAVYIYARLADGATITRRLPTVMYQNPQCLIPAKPPLSICPHGPPRNDASACTKSPKAGIITNKLQDLSSRHLAVSRSLSGLEIGQAQTCGASVLQTEILRSFDTNSRFMQ